MQRTNKEMLVNILTTTVLPFFQKYFFVIIQNLIIIYIYLDNVQTKAKLLELEKTIVEYQDTIAKMIADKEEIRNLILQSVDISVKQALSQHVPQTENQYYIIGAVLIILTLLGISNNVKLRNGFNYIADQNIMYDRFNNNAIKELSKKLDGVNVKLDELSGPAFDVASQTTSELASEVANQIAQNPEVVDAISTVAKSL
jgi:hypothetical protein